MRYPLQDLVARMGVDADTARKKLRISGASSGGMFRFGLTLEQAERYAERAGFPLLDVWPAAVDEYLARLERLCAADGCEERFVPSNPRRIYCSNLCRDRRHKADWFRRRYQSDPEFRARQIERTNQYHREVVVPGRERRRERSA